MTEHRRVYERFVVDELIEEAGLDLTVKDKRFP